MKTLEEELQQLKIREHKVALIKKLLDQDNFNNLIFIITELAPNDEIVSKTITIHDSTFYALLGIAQEFMHNTLNDVQEK